MLLGVGIRLFFYYNTVYDIGQGNAERHLLHNVFLCVLAITNGIIILYNILVQTAFSAF